MGDDWTISASKLKKHDECPKRFELAYVDGYRDFGPENRYIRRGNAVHEAIEKTLTEMGLTDNITSDLKAAYRGNGGHEAYGLTDEDHRFVLSCLQTAGRLLKRREPEIKAVELEVEFGVDRPTITRDFGGHIDLCTEDRIWDWKTGNSDGKQLKEALQGGVYMAGYTYHFGEPPEAIDFVYLKDGEEKVRTIDASDDIWQKVLARARTLLADLEEGHFEADPKESKCHFCDVEVFCPASPVGAGAIDWRSYP